MISPKWSKWYICVIDSHTRLVRSASFRLPRCLAVIVFSPTSCSAPAPRTNWHVLELNIYENVTQ